MKRITIILCIAIILGISAAIGVSPSVAQNENRQATGLISNIMKTKHDTAKNSISNVR